jgi:hypothetical protein
MGGIQHFCCPLLVEFGAANPWTRPLPAAFDHLNLTDRAQKWPLETVKRRENGFRWPQRLQRNGVTLRPPIKCRIPPINGSTPVALYQWNLLERQKLGIPLIKGIATLVAKLRIVQQLLHGNFRGL